MNILDPIYRSTDLKAIFLIAGEKFYSLQKARDALEKYAYKKIKVALWIVDPIPRKIAHT